MRKFYLFLALNIGGTIGWWAGEFFDIWMALIGSAIGSIVFIWLFWRYRDYFGE